MRDKYSSVFLMTPLAFSISFVATPLTAMAENFVLEEVVVTSQKRVESLQDVPISVSAVDGEKMQEAGIENLKDLSAYVPNLKVSEGGLVPQVFIRGIGSGQNQGFEQSVGTYADGIYMGRSLQARSAFMDLERVEVLRGPQSILFGKNSIAGAMSLVSAKPSAELEASASISHAPQYDETEFNGVLSGPLTDNLSARLALRDRQEGGYLDNKTQGKDQPNLEDRALRTTLVWDASDALQVTLKLERSEIEQGGRAFQPESMGALAPFAPNEDLSLDDTKWSNSVEELSFDSDNVMLKLDYGLGEHTLTAISGYSQYDFSEDSYDVDTSEMDLVSMDMEETFDQFSQEIRLVSPGGELVDYIVGAFYQTSEQQYREDAALKVQNVVLTSDGARTVRPFEQQSDVWAVFAQATWNINEALRLTAGLRYTEEEKEGARSQQSYRLSDGASVSDPATTVVVDPLGLHGHPLSGMALPLSQVLAGYNLVDHSLSDKRDEEVLTPSLNLQYDISGDVMLYATYSTGYKSGGFDARGINGWDTATATAAAAATAALTGAPLKAPNAGGDTFTFNEEEAETFELGAKMSLLDGAAELNAALFQTQYTDMQVSVYDGGFGFNVTNAGAATVSGLELDGRWRVSEGLTLSGAMSYLDFEWDDYEVADCPTVGSSIPSPVSPGNCDFTGRENEQTPEWQASLSAHYVQPVGETLELRATLDANFKDNHYTSGNQDPRQEQGAVTKFNARVALGRIDSRWQLALVGKNLTDEITRAYGSKVALSGNGITTVSERPRTIAIEASFAY